MMDNLYDLGTDVPYTHEDLEALFQHKELRPRKGVRCRGCSWFEPDSDAMCSGPLTCAKWMACGKCCSLTGRSELIDFEQCTHFKVDPFMSH